MLSEGKEEIEQPCECEMQDGTRKRLKRTRKKAKEILSHLHNLEELNKHGEAVFKILVSEDLLLNPTTELIKYSNHLHNVGR